MSMKPQNKKYAILLTVVFVMLSAMFEFSITYIFGGDAIQSALNRVAFYAVTAVVCVILWFVGIKVLHLDAQGPVPWYASPVVWLSPILVVTLIVMFSGAL